jgi:hypothetical protein
MAARPPDAISDPALPAQAAVPRGRERPGYHEFVLNDGTRARVRVERAAESMLVTFLDSAGTPLAGSPVVLREDFSQLVGRSSITGYWAPARGLPIAENAGHDGVLRVFVVFGSSSVRFFQYSCSEVSLDLGMAGGVLCERTPWRLDSGSPYSGSFKSEELDATWMLDGPGTAPDFDPFAAVRRMAKDADHDAADELPDDAVFKLTHDFETLPNADGTLLGSITWGYTMTWTLSGGAPTGPHPSAVTPVWRPPAEMQAPQPESLGTSWNPRAATPLVVDSEVRDSTDPQERT